MIHLLFEQTNTFRDVFRKKGIDRSKMSHEFAEFFIENFIN